MKTLILVLLSLSLTACNTIPDHVAGFCLTKSMNYGMDYDSCVQNYDELSKPQKRKLVKELVVRLDGDTLILVE